MIRQVAAGGCFPKDVAGLFLGASDLTGLVTKKYMLCTSIIHPFLQILGLSKGLCVTRVGGRELEMEM